MLMKNNTCISHGVATKNGPVKYQLLNFIHGISTPNGCTYMLVPLANKAYRISGSFGGLAIFLNCQIGLGDYSIISQLK